MILDECHFATPKQIETLRDIAESVPVYAFGLKTNFKSLLFDGSKRLLELADSVEELKSKCACGNPATLNGRFTKGFMQLEGEEIVLGNNLYKGLCYSCFKKEIFRSQVYGKVCKYLDAFKDRKSVGVWSTDTARDSMVVERPFVIYDKDVQEFISDFDEFKTKDSKDILIVEDNVKFLEKIKISDKDSQYMLMLITCVFKMEKNKPGMLKTLIESGIMTKWLNQIKKTI